MLRSPPGTSASMRWRLQDPSTSLGENSGDAAAMPPSPQVTVPVGQSRWSVTPPEAWGEQQTEAPPLEAAIKAWEAEVQALRSDYGKRRASLALKAGPSAAKKDGQNTLAAELQELMGEWQAAVRAVRDEYDARRSAGGGAEPAPTSPGAAKEGSSPTERTSLRRRTSFSERRAAAAKAAKAKMDGKAKERRSSAERKSEG